MQQKLSLRLVPINENSKEEVAICIEVSDLHFLASGSEHTIFMHTKDEQKHEVLIVNRQARNQEANQNQIMTMLQTVYCAVMQQTFKEINQYRWPRKAYRITNFDDTPKLYKCLEQQVIKHSPNIPDLLTFKLDAANPIIYIGSNIFHSPQFNVFVQFKPKSILPDVYSNQLLARVSQQISLTQNQLQALLKESEPNEKIRWYKKTIPSESNKNKKTNENPLCIYSIQGYENNNINLLKTKAQKKLPTLTEEEQKFVNHRILNCVREKGILDKIHQIQSLYTNSPQSIGIQNWEDLNLNFLNANLLLKQVLHKIQVKRKNKGQPKLNKWHEFLKCFSCTEVEQQKEQYSEIKAVAQLFLFLLSLTFKDVSIVYRAKWNEGATKDQQIWLIDDYLKKCNKVQENIEKDETLLTNYIRLKFKQTQL